MDGFIYNWYTGIWMDLYIIDLQGFQWIWMDLYIIDLEGRFAKDILGKYQPSKSIKPCFDDFFSNQWPSCMYIIFPNKHVGTQMSMFPSFLLQKTKSFGESMSFWCRERYWLEVWSNWFCSSIQTMSHICIFTRLYGAYGHLLLLIQSMSTI